MNKVKVQYNEKKLINSRLIRNIYFVFSIISAVTLAQPYALANDVSLPPNIIQILDNFGLIPVKCNDETSKILIGARSVCVQPTDTVPLGSYRYDDEQQVLIPLLSETVNSLYQFSFTRLAEYNNCLEDVIRFYQNSALFWQRGRVSNCLEDIFQANAKDGLTKEQALEIINAADEYATKLLTPPLYPLYGIRRQINQEFGFVYKIDREKQ